MKLPIGLKVTHLNSDNIATIKAYSVDNIYDEPLYEVVYDGNNVNWYCSATIPFGNISRLLYG